MNDETRSLLIRLQQCEEWLSGEEIKLLCKLLRKAEPAKPQKYWGTVEGVRHRLTKCPACGRNLRTKKAVEYPEENRFCPGCGQRIDWWRVMKDDYE